MALEDIWMQQCKLCVVESQHQEMSEMQSLNREESGLHAYDLRQMQARILLALSQGLEDRA